MTTSTERNRALGQAWLDAFNRGDVEGLVALYAEDCTHTSPKLRVQKPETGGKIVGKAELHAWWKGAFERLKGLRYEGFSVTANEERVVLEYWRHAPNEAPMPVAEAFDVRDGKIFASRVYHG